MSTNNLIPSNWHCRNSMISAILLDIPDDFVKELDL